MGIPTADFVGSYNRIVIPGFLRWCERISSNLQNVVIPGSRPVKINWSSWLITMLAGIRSCECALDHFADALLGLELVPPTPNTLFNQGIMSTLY